jgi:hypothetical protein
MQTCAAAAGPVDLMVGTDPTGRDIGGTIGSAGKVVRLKLEQSARWFECAHRE